MSKSKTVMVKLKVGEETIEVPIRPPVKCGNDDCKQARRHTSRYCQNCSDKHNEKIGQPLKEHL